MICRFFLVLSSLLLPWPATADSPPVFALRWGGFGSAPGQLNTPLAICVAPDGTVLVADSGNNRIQRFTPNGAFLSMWGQAGSDTASFDSPNGVAVDAAGFVYVTDINGRVQQFDPQGHFLKQWRTYDRTGQHTNTRHIAIFDNALLFVTLESSNIACYDTSGTLVAIWGSFGSADGQFYGPPIGIAVSHDGYVYACDKLGLRIEKFARDGVFIADWGLSQDYTFRYPYGVTVTSTGKVLVAMGYECRSYDPEGHLLAKWGNIGNEDGNFFDAYDIAATTNAGIFVVDGSQHSVQKFLDVTTPVINASWGDLKAQYRPRRDPTPVFRGGRP